jgi:hypothetical protein
MLGLRPHGAGRAGLLHLILCRLVMLLLSLRVELLLLMLDMRMMLRMLL